MSSLNSYWIPTDAVAMDSYRLLTEAILLKKKKKKSLWPTLRVAEGVQTLGKNISPPLCKIFVKHFKKYGAIISQLCLKTIAPSRLFGTSKHAFKSSDHLHICRVQGESCLYNWAVFKVCSRASAKLWLQLASTAALWQIAPEENLPDDMGLDNLQRQVQSGCPYVSYVN